MRVALRLTDSERYLLRRSAKK